MEYINFHLCPCYLLCRCQFGLGAVRDLETWQRSSPFPESHLLENSFRGGNPHIKTRVVEDELVEQDCRPSTHVSFGRSGSRDLIQLLWSK